MIRLRDLRAHALTFREIIEQAAAAGTSVGFMMNAETRRASRPERKGFRFGGFAEP